MRRRLSKRGGERPETHIDVRWKCRWHCVIKLRIVREGLIVLASHFNRSQRDNCSIFPLICETPPRAASSTGGEESGGKTKREKERNIYMRVQIYIYIWMPFVNISILMIWATEFSAYFSLDVQPIARGESGSEKEREKRGKEQEKSDG